MNVLARFVHRLSTDAAFRRELMEHKDSALRWVGETLSPEDREVLQHVLSVLDRLSYEINPDWPQWDGYTDVQAVEHI